jgi:hypothetical protein
MSKLKKHINKEELIKIFSLYSRQPWLMDKEENFIELLLMCETSEHKKLILELLAEFHFLEFKTLNNFLNLIADFIITDSGFSESTTQIAAITYDDEADSSQKILDYIKMPLHKQGWADIKTVNRFGATIKNYNEGKTQILFIDEFVGSGSTIAGRVKQLKNDIKGDFELKFCFIAGMDYGIKNIEELGYEVYCPLRLPKGISERFVHPELETKTELMTSLEGKLAQSINSYNLPDYSFGYNKAEALYSLEGSNGNTPNSVFPIFWWPRTKDGKQRNTLLTRFEKGLK